MSFGEACVSTLIGFLINLAVQRITFPWFGFHPPLLANLGISSIFTVVGVCRGYVIRRLFDWWDHRNA